MTINNYVIEFERAYHKSENYDMELLDDVLVNKFLNNTNISEHHKQLVLVILSELNAIQEQLKNCSIVYFTGSVKED